MQSVAAVEVTDACETGEFDDGSFKSLVVVEFSTKIPPSSVQWLVDKMTLPKADQGCELLSCNILDEDHQVTKIHLSASTERLLDSAERMEIKKEMKKDGSMREFSRADMHLFKNAENPYHFLTTAEKQRIILHELESIRATESERFKLPNIKFYDDEAVIPRCLKEGIIVDMYALHDRSEVNTLSDLWIKKIIRKQPLDKIQHYFGETVAFYFAFLGFYTMFLIPPAVFGVVSHFFVSWLEEDTAVVLFCLFNLVWATVFLESWKRRTAELAYRWGTLGMEQFEEPRATFYGRTIEKDPVTGRLLPQYPSSLRLMKFYFVSVPVMAFMLFITFMMMLFYFKLESLVHEYIKESSLPAIVCKMIALFPTVSYALVIMVLYAVWGPLAKLLNDWENHRIQSAYDNHLITKLLIFNFSNYFLSLFYVAFYLQDFVMLRQHLATLLITMQLVQQVQESLLPYLIYKWRKVSIVKKFFLHEHEIQKHGISPKTLLYAERDAAKQPYSSTMEDYLEMCLQFGYVFFFSAVFPTAAFWALINNLIEVRTDAFKLCRTLRRPFARPASNIGVWAVAFEIMSVVAVITNCALLALSPQLKQYWTDYGALNVTLAFIAAEHLMLFLKIAIAYLVPDYPEWVETALAAAEYQSKKAWKQPNPDEHAKTE